MSLDAIIFTKFSASLCIILLVHDGILYLPVQVELIWINFGRKTLNFQIGIPENNDWLMKLQQGDSLYFQKKLQSIRNLLEQNLNIQKIEFS